MPPHVVLYKAQGELHLLVSASSANIKNAWSYTPLPIRLRGVHRDNLILCLFIIFLRILLIQDEYIVTI
jgi:hypothetical protein